MPRIRKTSRRRIPENIRKVVFIEYNEGLRDGKNKGFLRKTISEKHNISPTAICKIHEVELLKVKIAMRDKKIKELEEENRKLAANQRKVRIY